MYSNTMMVLLNSRMVYGIENDTASTESAVIYRRSFISTLQVGVSVTHESDWPEHPEVSKTVGRHYINLEIDIESLSWRMGNVEQTRSLRLC
jgi:hypothetical protein